MFIIVTEDILEGIVLSKIDHDDIVVPPVIPMK